MRILLAVLLATLPSVVSAQSSEGSSLPPIGLPLPPIGLPLPPIGLAPATPTPTTSPRSSPDRERRGGRPRRGSNPSVIYVVPAYGGYAPGMMASPLAPASGEGLAAATPGTLTLDVPDHPAAQVFVNGAFVGSVADASKILLDAGTHLLEIREPGFEVSSVRVRVESGRAITYRGVLARPEEEPTAADPPMAEPRAPAAAPAQIPRKPFYYIAGCYLGDVPPLEARLPASCDPSRAVTIWP